MGNGYALTEHGRGLLLTLKHAVVVRRGDATGALQVITGLGQRVLPVPGLAAEADIVAGEGEHNEIPELVFIAVPALAESCQQC